MCEYSTLSLSYFFSRLDSAGTWIHASNGTGF